MDITQKSGFDKTYSKTNKGLIRRYSRTLEFVKKNIKNDSKILDLGIVNPFSDILTNQGFSVINTEKDMDLDFEFDIVKKNDFDVVTAFELFEHMVAPFNLLRAINAPKLIASVPLKLWFANAYWNEKDPWDRHYHEFEPRQFDMLLIKAGWKIIKSEKWVSPSNKIGIRPLLRSFTPRYYIVYCERE
ncbi:MAG: hypothetical protein RBR40_15455 [Tenuifilaceae bacterium]|jgi:hypothetical protein|nr:hypothetical protein [Tenuifilaceae bacterium]